MNQKYDRYIDTIALTIVLWLCSLVLVGLVILPLFGPAGGDRRRHLAGGIALPATHRPP